MTTPNMTLLQMAINELGPYTTARACGVKGPSVYKWLERGCLPRTEWTGESNYATAISAALSGKFTVEQLLQRPDKDAT